MESELIYEKIGHKGPALVLLHGWGQSLQNLKPLADVLSHNWQVFLFDLPGFGKAQVPPDVWSSFDYADYIMQAMHSMRVDSFSLVGHSFGGKVAMSMAVKYPKQIDALVLLAASGLRRKHSFLSKVRRTSIGALRALVKANDRLFHTKWFTTFFIPRFGSKDYKLSGQMRPILVKTVSEDFTHHLQKISCPTLLLWGENDQETPVEMAWRLHSHIKNSKLYVFSHKNHYLLQDCGYHLCAQYIKDFFMERYG